MKNYIKNIAIVLFVALLLVSCTAFDNKNNQQITTCSVSATAEVTVDPDIALFTIEVSEIADTTKKALNQANFKMSALLQTLRDFGILEKDMKTTSINLRPEYNWIDGKQELIGQRARQSVSIKLRDLDKLGNIIDNLSEISGISLGSIVFDKEDKSTAIEEARILAVRKAEQQAKLYAQTTGMELGYPLDINSNSYSPSPYRMNTLAKSAVMYDESASYSTETPVGQSTITSTVNIVYQFLKPSK